MNPNVEDGMTDETVTYGGGTPWLVYWGRKLRHWLAHLIPRTHWTKYRIEAWEQEVADMSGEELEDVDDLETLGADREDQQWVCIWRQWLGFQWGEVHFRVVEAA